MDMVYTDGINASRHRVMFRFWLDVAKELDCFIADELEALRSVRQMKPVIVQALRLFFDLRSGSTDVLYEFHPHLKPVMEASQMATVSTPRPTKQYEPIQLGEVRKAKQDKDANANYNFAIAMASFNEKYDELPEDVIEYGLRKGLIQMNQVPQRHPKPSNPNKITGSDVALSVPDFDDLSIEVT